MELKATRKVTFVLPPGSNEKIKVGNDEYIAMKNAKTVVVQKDAIFSYEGVSISPFTFWRLGCTKPDGTKPEGAVNPAPKPEKTDPAPKPDDVTVEDRANDEPQYSGGRRR